VRLLPFDHAVRNLGRRPRQTALVGAAAFVVALLALAAVGFVRGVDRALGQSGDPRNVLVLGAGSEESVERSEVEAGLAGILEASIPGLERRLGTAFVSPEIHLGLRVGPDEAGRLAMVRGVTDRAFLVHPRVRIAAGRLPRPGADEALVGRVLAAEVFGSDHPESVLGATLPVDGSPLRVVGLLAAPGTVVESEVWAPLADLQALTRRDRPSCVVLGLADPGAFAEVEALAFRRLDLEIVAMRETAYYAAQGRILGPVRSLGLATAALIALAAVLGGLNTLFASFSGRTRELAALQVLGFRRRAIVLSLVAESLVVHASGGLLAVGAALWALDGLAVRFSTGSFGLALDGITVAAGLGATLAVGVLGALPPAFRALRIPLRDALRAT
jgi:hypothetical protein